MSNPYHTPKAQWAAYVVFFAVLGCVPLVVENTFTVNLLARFLVLGMLALSAAAGYYIYRDLSKRGWSSIAE